MFVHTVYNNIICGLFKLPTDKEMKKFFSLLVLLLTVFALPASAEEKASSVMLDFKEPPEPTASTEEIINRFIETAKYFDTTYPGDQIYQDFHEDVAKQMPWLSPQETYDYQHYIRQGMQLYRYFKNIYNQYVAAKLTPKDPPLIAKNSDYDLSSPESDYIESDEALIIPDFKRIISYSNNPREIEAYRAKLASDTEKTGKLAEFSELGYIFSRLEFKKLPFYNLFYGSPLTGDKGIGEWVKKDDCRLRLITVQTAVSKEEREINGLIHLLLPKDAFITAVDSGKYFKPEIDFSGSENLRHIDYTLPLPTRLAGGGEDWTIYFGEVAIPFSAEVDAPDKEVLLKARVRLNLCQKPGECRAVEFFPEVMLEPGRPRDSSVATYIRMMTNFLPPKPQSELKINGFYNGQTADGKQMLTLVFDSPEKLETFTFYISNKEGISFEKPRISIDGKRATVRILPLDGSPDAAGKKFEITAEANREYVLRRELTPENGKMPPDSRLKTLILMFAAAFAGGFLLNFMPCVFPVLSLKLLSLTKFGARNASNVRRNFALTLAGIWSAMLLLAALLALLKHLGQSIGWGMQFQNPLFVLIIFFAVLLFIAEIWGIIDIRLPLPATAKTNNNGLLHFLTGTFVVLMSTPCTAPYLGTAVGFALAGTTVDIFAIFAGVATGLSLPYVLFWLFPHLAGILPPPGSWMQKVNGFMLLMLFLTIVWLLHIVSAQTNGWFVFRLAMYGILFWFLLWLRYLSLTADLSTLPAETGQKAARLLASIFAGASLLLFAGAVADGHFAAERRLNKIEETRLSSTGDKEIESYLKKGKTVLVTVGADWCLTCRYNDIMVFANPAVINNIKSRGVVVLNIDWTIRNADTLRFMKKYGRSGLPFYILFTPLVPDGLILPEILTERELNLLIDNLSLQPAKH